MTSVANVEITKEGISTAEEESCTSSTEVPSDGVLSNKTNNGNGCEKIQTHNFLNRRQDRYPYHQYGTIKLSQ
jgi:hypothetical protein